MILPLCNVTDIALFIMLYTCSLQCWSIRTLCSSWSFGDNTL